MLYHSSVAPVCGSFARYLSCQNGASDSGQTVRFSRDDNRTGLAAFGFNDHQGKVIESLAVIRRKNLEISGIAVVGNDNFAGTVNERERHTSSGLQTLLAMLAELGMADLLLILKKSKSKKPPADSVA